MDIVLGVSTSPSTIRTVLVAGDNADGVIVEADDLAVAAADESATAAAAEQLVTAILAAHRGADEAGDQLRSIGVTWTDELEVAGLRQALAARKAEGVVLISAFVAAAALAQTVGRAIGYERIAMLFIEPGCATLAVVDAADGSITDVHKELLNSEDVTAELTEMVAGLESLETCPKGLFVVGSGVDIAPIKSGLQTATALAVTAPEEPETALARGAALASANAPLFASSTAALAYAQDPGTGEVDLDAVAPGYFYVPDVPADGEPGEEELAYSAVPDEEADALTEVMDTADDNNLDESEQRRRPVLLLGSAGAVVAISAVLAMEVALALGIRPGVALRPSPGHNLIVPTQQAPAPPAQVSGPQPRYISQPGAVAAPHPLNPPAPGAPPPAAPMPAAAPVPVPVPPRGVQDPAAAAAPAPTPDSPPPPLNIPAPQPPEHAPASPPAHVPVSQPPTQVPVSQPPAHVPVSQPPTHLPVPPPPAHVPVPPPPAHVPEPQPPVNLPPPEAPPIPGLSSHEAPPAPGMPGHEAPPAPDVPPARGGEGGTGAGPGGDVGGHGSGGGGDEGGAGIGSHGLGGGEIGGGISGGGIGGGGIGGGSGGGGEISSSGGGSSGGGIGGGSGGGGGEIGSSGGGSSGGSTSSGGSSGDAGGSSAGGGHH